MKRVLILASCLVLSPWVAAASFKTEKWTTANGVQVVFYQAMEVPMLDISLAFAAGSAYDGQAYGLSALTADLLNQGNQGESADAIADQLADVGAQLNSDTSRDMSVFSLRTLTKPDAMKPALATFAKVINHPDFPQDAFDREKKQQLVSIEQVKESPDEIANQVFFARLYEGHPYAHPVIGDREHVQALQRQQVVDFYHQYFVGHNAYLVMVGAIDSAQAHQIANQISGSLPAGQAAPAIPKAKPLSKAEQVAVEFASTQTALRLGQLGIDHQDPDYFPLLVGNYILGGGVLVSRLSLEIREKEGLTYGVYSQFSPMPGDGPFLISLSTEQKQTNKALTLTEQVLGEFLEQGPTAQELVAAKQYLIGSFPLSLASNSAIASMLLRVSFYHLPDSFLDQYTQSVEKVSLQQIKQAFDKHVDPSKFLIVKVGKRG